MSQNSRDKYVILLEFQVGMYFLREQKEMEQSLKHKSFGESPKL